MDAGTARQIQELRSLTVTELRVRYTQAFGEECRSHNKTYLFRRLAWRLQAVAEGDLSQRARRRALEIASDADLRVGPPRSGAAHGVTALGRSPRDARLPRPGTLLTREFRGKVFVVKILEDGFEFNGKDYRSLSAIARIITATRWNGYTFFALRSPAQEARLG